MAQDSVNKRKNIITNAVIHSERIVDALNALIQLKAERDDLDSPIIDSDCVNGNSHLTAGIVGTLFDFVLPDLKATFDETQNNQILNQMRH